MAANELNHSRTSPTNQQYLKIEDRDLLKNEEEDLFNDEMDEIIFGYNLSKKIFDNIDKKEKAKRR